jgi:hypothetical protein
VQAKAKPARVVAVEREVVLEVISVAREDDHRDSAVFLILAGMLHFPLDGPKAGHASWVS